jgi:hypothetical protein
MEHGRDHDERLSKFSQNRFHETQPGEPEEPGRAKAGHGSEHAPTREAERHEAERHARERAEGHLAAGTEGRIKANQPPEPED